jgi:hypothetical protein
MKMFFWRTWDGLMRKYDSSNSEQQLRKRTWQIVCKFVLKIDAILKNVTKHVKALIPWVGDIRKRGIVPLEGIISQWCLIDLNLKGMENSQWGGDAENKEFIFRGIWLLGWRGFSLTGEGKWHIGLALWPKGGSKPPLLSRAKREEAMISEVKSRNSFTLTLRREEKQWALRKLPEGSLSRMSPSIAELASQPWDC